MEKLKDKIIFRNPCRWCLIRPMCKKECNKFEFYLGTMEIMSFISALVVFISSIICLCLVFFQIVFINTSLKIILCLLFFGGIYFHYTIKLIEESYSSIEKVNPFLKLLVIILNPWGEMITEVIDHFKLDDKLSDFAHRYRNRNGV